jgi:hypothetical protein
MPHPLVTSLLSRSSWLLHLSQISTQKVHQQMTALRCSVLSQTLILQLQHHVLLQLQVPFVTTSIWHQAFDSTLSHHSIMIVLNTTFVPVHSITTVHMTTSILNSVIHATCLLLPHIKDSLSITTTTHTPNLFADLSSRLSFIKVATHTYFLLHLIVSSNRRELSTQITISQAGLQTFG